MLDGRFLFSSQDFGKRTNVIAYEEMTKFWMMQKVSKGHI